MRLAAVIGTIVLAAAGCRTVPVLDEDGQVVTRPDGSVVETTTGEVDPVKVEDAVTAGTSAAAEGIERGDEGADTALAVGGAILPFLGPQAQLFGGAALSLISLLRRKK